MIIATIAMLFQPTERIGGHDTITWNRSIRSRSTFNDGVETAKSMFGIDIKPTEYFTVTVDDFAAMDVGNHRAVVGVPLERIYPADDSPRGAADVAAVNYFMNADTVDPIMVLEYHNKLYVIDGVHRLVAAYLTGSIIRYCRFVEKPH